MTTYVGEHATADLRCSIFRLANIWSQKVEGNRPYLRLQEYQIAISSGHHESSIARQQGHICVVAPSCGA